jgi:hypothetical protein
MTGPFVPVGILNPIRAVVGIPIIDSTFSSNALAAIDLLLRDARSYGDTTALSFEASNRSISILAR